jgi:hypothetical protein
MIRAVKAATAIAAGSVSQRFAASYFGEISARAYAATPK